MQNECKYSFSILIYPHVSYRATNGSVISYQTIRNICINLDNKGESALNKRVCQPHKGATEKHNKVLWWLKWMNGRIYYYINTRNLTLLLSPSLCLPLSSFVTCLMQIKWQGRYTSCVYAMWPSNRFIFRYSSTGTANLVWLINALATENLHHGTDYEQTLSQGHRRVKDRPWLGAKRRQQATRF